MSRPTTDEKGLTRWRLVPPPCLVECSACGEERLGGWLGMTGPHRGLPVCFPCHFAVAATEEEEEAKEAKT